METQEAKQIIDAALTSFELRTVERLRKAEDGLAEKVRALETKVQDMRQIALVIGGVALIFGVTGAWGLNLLNNARTQLKDADQRVAELKRQVDVLTANTSTVQSAVDAGIERLQRASAQQIEQFRQGAKTEADAAISAFRDRVATLSPATDVRANSLQIVNAAGKTMVSLAAGRDGGIISILNATTGNEIGALAAADNGSGGLSLSNSAGHVLLRGNAYGNGGDFRFFNDETGKKIVDIGAGLSGDGGIWLSNKAGQELARGVSFGSGGNWVVFNTSGQSIGDFGSTAQGDGGLWLENKAGQKVLEGNTTGVGGNWYAYSADHGRLLGSIGASLEGNGGLWLFDQSGKQIIK